MVKIAHQRVQKCAILHIQIISDLIPALIPYIFARLGLVIEKILFGLRVVDLPGAVITGEISKRGKCAPLS